MYCSIAALFMSYTAVNC